MDKWLVQSSSTPHCSIKNGHDSLTQVSNSFKEQILKITDGNALGSLLDFLWQS